MNHLRQNAGLRSVVPASILFI